MIGQGFISQTPLSVLLGVFILYTIFWISRRRAYNSNKETLKKKKPLIQLVLFGFFTAIIIYILYGHKGIAIPVLIMIAVILILWFVSRFTAFGRYVYAVGGGMLKQADFQESI